MKMRNKYISFPIDAIIQANLEMQTIQRELNKLGIKNPSLITFRNPNFLNQYNSWNEEKQNNCIKLIGGNANYKKTKGFIESLKVGV
jgi:hypothetical protein